MFTQTEDLKDALEITRKALEVREAQAAQAADSGHEIASVVIELASERIAAALPKLVDDVKSGEIDACGLVEVLCDCLDRDEIASVIDENEGRILDVPPVVAEAERTMQALDCRYSLLT